MRKLALPLLIVAALSTTSAMAATTTMSASAPKAMTSAMAPAAPTMTTGTISKLSAKACTVTLDKKTTYYFAAKCDLSKVKVGDKVTITWTAKGKKDMASAIAAATA